MNKKQLEETIEKIKQEVNDYNSCIISSNEAVVGIYNILGMNNKEELLERCGFYKSLEEKGIDTTEIRKSIEEALIDNFPKEKEDE